MRSTTHSEHDTLSSMPGLLTDAEKANFVLDKIEELVVDHDLDLRILWANRAACESVGLHSRSIIGKYCYEVWYKRKQPCEGCPVLQTIETGKPQTAELTTDSRTRIIKCYPTTDSNGRVKSAVAVTVDITDIRQVEISKEESEATYKQLVEQSLQGIIVIQDMRLLFANPALAKMTGYTVDEILNLDPDGVRNLVHPDDQDLVWGRYQTRLKAQTIPQHYTFRGVRKDGTIWNAEIYASAVVVNGKPAIQAALLDVTEAVRAEEALRKSEEKYRSLVENINEVIFTLDPSGRFTYISPVIKQMLGYQPDEIIGKPFDCFVHPDDTPTLLVTFERCATDPQQSEELRVISKDGTTHFIRISCTASYDTEEFKGITGIMADITETKRASEIIRERQQMYETLLKTTTDAVAVIDLEGNFTEVSQRTANLFGVESPEKLIAKNAFSFVVPSYQRKALMSFKEALRSGCIREKDFIMTRSDGSHFSAQIDAALIHDGTGNPKAFILTIKDVTEAKRFERQLKNTQQRFKDIAQLSREWIWEIDPNCVVTYSNGAVESMLGYKAEEILGAYIHDFVFASDALSSWEKLVQLLQGRQDLDDWLITFRSKQGRPIPMTLRAVPVLNDDGNLIGYRGTASQDEHSSSKADDLMLKLLSMDEAIILADMHGKVLFINRNAENLLGKDREEVLNRDLDKTFCLSSSTSEKTDLRQSVETGKFQGTANLIRSDGSHLEISFSSAIVHDASRSPSGILIVFTPSHSH